MTEAHSVDSAPTREDTAMPQETPETTALRESFSMQYDADHLFPFIEDENCNITGYGHQDKAEFAAAVNRYDEVCCGRPLPEGEQYEAGDMGHAWVRLDPDGEHLHLCSEDTEGAIPVTGLWGVR